MVLYKTTVTLLDRKNPNRVGGESPDLPISLTGTTIGDMVPWLVRLELDNTGADGEINSGRLTLRTDELKTFISTGPILVDEVAKKNYLIEAQITQTDPAGGADLEGKVFRFQLGTPTIDIDENKASILTITLQEIQYRIKESINARELRFVTPSQALNSRVVDFNNHQGGTGVSMIFSPSVGNKLPVAPELSYIPQSPQTIQQLFDEIFKKLEEPQVTGGVFTDFYYDFDPSAGAMLAVEMKADEIGRIDSGLVLEPLSTTVLDAAEEETVFTNLLRFKNNVIVRGAPNGGSLPTEHTKFASNWEHMRIADEYDDTNSITLRDGITSFNYLRGQKIKMTFDTTSITTDDGSTIPKVIRFFEALTNVGVAGGPNTSPDQDDVNWKEHFLIHPSYDIRGRYFEGDIIYNDDAGTITFYVAKRNIFTFTLGRFNGGLTTVLPNIPAPADWTALTSIIPTRTATNFVGWIPYSPWTTSLFDWEQNMAAIKTPIDEILPLGPDNRYVGLVPDWNMARDVYDKQDVTNEFERISIKWIQQKDINDPNTDLTPEDLYHGQRVLVGTAGTGDFAGESNKLAQYDKSSGGSGFWHFSDDPIANDIVINLDDGKVWHWTGSVWAIIWEVERLTPSIDRGNPVSPATPFHLVKDVYKTRGFDGTPNSAIEFRYAWDDTIFGSLPTGIDNAERKALLARLNSRGSWLWFWMPFPRTGHDHGGTGPTVEIGDNFGGNGATTGPITGFTTLNIFNNQSDRLQNLSGWNQGLNTEDMGKISGLAFRLKAGFFSNFVVNANDSRHGEMLAEVTGMPSIPMIFWALDMFDRIWFKRFDLRRNNRWDNVTIEFGDLSRKNLYFARWDELPDFLGIPLSGLSFTLKEKEYSGVGFDWRFVRGWGVMYAGSYDNQGFYNAGVLSWWEKIMNTASQIGATFTNIFITVKNWMDAAGQPTGTLDPDKKIPNDLRWFRQSTIAMDDLYYIKEQIANSDDVIVANARTHVEFEANESDYLNTKAIARAKKARLSFFPQFWTLRVIGDVRMRVGEAFIAKGDRTPNQPSQHAAWNIITPYNAGDKVSSLDRVYQARQDNLAQFPANNPDDWENLNKVSCASVKHIIDHTGYHMEVVARRKFITTGE